MRKQKLRLDLDSLDIESFTTDQAGEQRGTVQANSNTHIADCGWSWVGSSCGSSVWEKGCSEVTAAADCAPTEGGYAGCQFTM